MTTDTGDAAPEPQAVIAPLTGAAIFLVVELAPGEDSAGHGAPSARTSPAWSVPWVSGIWTGI